MFKKLLISVLAIIFLSTSALIAAELDNEYETGYEAEYTAEAETTRVVERFTESRGSGAFSSWDGERTFDNAIDLMYFNLFGDGFELIKSHSTDVNRTINHGNWQLNVISTVAIAERSFTSAIWPDNAIVKFDEETGAWVIINEETGEVILEEELEKADFTSVRVHTFFSIKDTSGEIDLANGFEIIFRENLADTRRLGDGTFSGHAGWGHLDEESGAMYLVATHWGTVEELGDNININFVIDRILADWRHFTEEIEVDFAYLLENHEATFIVENVQWRGGSSSGEMREILGEDFDPFSADAEIMARGELNIPLAHGIYLTNIALRDNLLLVQTRQSDFSRESWGHASLIDTRVKPIDWENTPTMSEAELEKLFNLQMSRFPQSLYSIDVSLMDENFQIIGNRYTEKVFHIEDLGSLNYLAFEVSHGYFAVVRTVNLVGPSLNSPVINQRLVVESDAEVVIYGTASTIKDIEISPLEISFVIGYVQPLFNTITDSDRWFDISEHIQIELIHKDGTESGHSIRSTGWSTSWDDDKILELRVFFGGSVLDIDNLAAIRVNGVLIEVQ